MKTDNGKLFRVPGKPITLYFDVGTLSAASELVKVRQLRSISELVRNLVREATVAPAEQDQPAKVGRAK